MFSIDLSHILSSFYKKSIRVLKVSKHNQPANYSVHQTYGVYSRIKPSKTSQAILLYIRGSQRNCIAIEYDKLKEPIDLKEGEVKIQNPETKANIYCKQDGSIEIKKDNDSFITINQDGSINITASTVNLDTTAANITASTVNIDGDIVNIGDGVSNVLNENAIITDSLGNPCVIQNAGQVKVKA